MLNSVRSARKRKYLRLLSEGKEPRPMKEFLTKLFELCKNYQQEIAPHEMAEVLRDYEERLDG